MSILTTFAWDQSCFELGLVHIFLSTVKDERNVIMFLLINHFENYKLDFKNSKREKSFKTKSRSYTILSRREV